MTSLRQKLRLLFPTLRPGDGWRTGVAVALFAAGVQAVRSVASPLRLQATPPVLTRAAPALGEHTEEVLRALGLNASRVAALRSAGVV